MTSTNFKDIGLTQPGFKPTRFGFPDFPRWETDALLIRPTRLDGSLVVYIDVLGKEQRKQVEMTRTHILGIPEQCVAITPRRVPDVTTILTPTSVQTTTRLSKLLLIQYSFGGL